MIYYWLNPRFLPLFSRKRKRTHQWHPRATGWVRTLDGVCPEPSDNGCLATALLFWQSNLWIEIADTLPCLIVHPFAIVANILSQTLCALPLVLQERFA